MLVTFLMNGFDSVEFAIKFQVMVIVMATQPQKPIKIQVKVSNKKENASVSIRRGQSNSTCTGVVAGILHQSNRPTSR